MKQRSFNLFTHNILQQQYGAIAPSPAATGARGKHSNKEEAAIPVFIVLGALAVLAVLLFNERRRKAKGKINKRSHGHAPGNGLQLQIEQQYEAAHPNGGRLNKGPINTLPSLSKKPLLEPTKNLASSDDMASRSLITLQEGWPTFDMDYLLRSSAEPLHGTGAFGSTYKVRQEGLPMVVIKHLREAKVGCQDFKNRIGDLAKFNHPNVLPIVAYYFSEDEKILLYEYLALGNLCVHIHGTGEETWTPLDWPTRAKIAFNVANGISYLHARGKNKGMLHGNIKASNVLLTPSHRYIGSTNSSGAAIKACVTDYGLTHLIRSSPTTSPAAPNAGYRAPEVSHNRHLTHKSDVYSYGVLLLELLTAKEPFSPTTNQVLNLPHLIHSSIHEEWTAEIFDAKIPQRVQYEEEMVHMLKIAMECVHDVPRERPSMAKVVDMMKMVREFEDGLASGYTDVSTPASEKHFESDFV